MNESYICFEQTHTKQSVLWNFTESQDVNFTFVLNLIDVISYRLANMTNQSRLTNMQSNM